MFIGLEFRVLGFKFRIQGLHFHCLGCCLGLLGGCFPLIQFGNFGLHLEPNGDRRLAIPCLILMRLFQFQSEALARLDRIRTGHSPALGDERPH